MVPANCNEKMPDPLNERLAVARFYGIVHKESHAILAVEMRFTRGWTTGNECSSVSRTH